jgi:hypothetical protein
LELASFVGFVHLPRSIRTFSDAEGFAVIALYGDLLRRYAQLPYLKRQGYQKAVANEMSLGSSSSSSSAGTSVNFFFSVVRLIFIAPQGSPMSTCTFSLSRVQYLVLCCIALKCIQIPISRGSGMRIATVLCKALPLKVILAILVMPCKY